MRIRSHSPPADQYLDGLQAMAAWEHSWALITLYGMEYPFGQTGSDVLAASHQNLLPTPTELLRRAEWETGKISLLWNHIWVITKALVCYQHWLATNQNPHAECCGEGYVCSSQTQCWLEMSCRTNALYSNLLFISFFKIPSPLLITSLSFSNCQNVCSKTEFL